MDTNVCTILLGCEAILVQDLWHCGVLETSVMPSINSPRARQRVLFRHESIYYTVERLTSVSYFSGFLIETATAIPMVVEFAITLSSGGSLRIAMRSIM